MKLIKTERNVTGMMVCSWAVAAVVINFSCLINEGLWNFLSFALISAAFIGVVLVPMAGGLALDERTAKTFIFPVISFLIFLQLIDLLFLSPAIESAAGIDLRWASWGLLAAGSFAFLSLWLSEKKSALILTGACLVFLGVGFFIVCVSHDPFIDVYLWHQKGLEALVGGENPYAIHIKNIYGESTPFYNPAWLEAGRVNAGYIYPPLVLLYGLPGFVFGGDIRWTFAVLGALTVALTFLHRSRFAFAAGALMLTTPVYAHILEDSYTEVLVAFHVCLVVFCARFHRRFLPLALGLLLVSKQYMLIFLPLAALLLDGPFKWKDFLKLAFKSLVVGAVVTLPFIMRDPSSFYRSAVQFHLKNPFRPDAVSVAAFYHHLTGHVLGGYWPWIMWSLCTGVVLRKMPRSAAGFAAGLGMTMLVFVLFSVKGAFDNYYFLISWCFLIALSALSIQAKEPASENVLNG